MSVTCEVDMSPLNKTNGFTQERSLGGMMWRPPAGKIGGKKSTF
jgi:hypothetical protein